MQKSYKLLVDGNSVILFYNNNFSIYLIVLSNIDNLKLDKILEFFVQSLWTVKTFDYTLSVNHICYKVKPSVVMRNIVITNALRSQTRQEPHCKQEHKLRKIKFLYRINNYRYCWANICPTRHLQENGWHYVGICTACWTNIEPSVKEVCYSSFYYAIVSHILKNLFY